MKLALICNNLFLCILLEVLSFGAAVSPDRGEQIKNCLNENFEFKKTNWNDTIERDAPST
jgi:hypothetical protein